MSTYPILFDSKPIGTLETVPDGLFTVFTARCRPVAERLRLAVFGETSRAYLGLMLPEGDGGDLCLRRRLTRLEREKNRLEKTIAQLTQRLEYVEESLANM